MAPADQASILRRRRITVPLVARRPLRENRHTKRLSGRKLPGIAINARAERAVPKEVPGQQIKTQLDRPGPKWMA